VEPALEVLSVRAALAAAGAIENATGGGVRIELKWPNDLMLGGRKLGGLLCEARWQGGALAWVAVGIGVNVRNPIPASLADSAIALGSVLKGVEPEPLAEPVAAAVAAIGAREGHLGAVEAADFAARDWLRGRRLCEPGTGTAEGVSPDGALRLRRDDGSVQEVRSGSILLAHG
jgi:BirA family biotin operon repressor/biotin-[acetyl-CoA-carboxylase] ligase